MLLANEVIEGQGAHSISQRPAAAVLLIGQCLEKTHSRCRPARLCRAASYSSRDAAIPALSDSTRGEWGIVTSSSAWDRISGGNPAPSLPIITAAGRSI